MLIEKLAPHTVQVSREGVAMFNARWPGSKLRDCRAYRFEFDSESALVDCDVPEDDDGPEVLALCADAAAWLFDGLEPEWMT